MFGELCDKSNTNPESFTRTGLPARALRELADLVELEPRALRELADLVRQELELDDDKLWILLELVRPGLELVQDVLVEEVLTNSSRSSLGSWSRPALRIRPL